MKQFISIMPKSTEKPVVVWERGKYRIVAREEPNEDGEPVPMLVMAVRALDMMDRECWREVPYYMNDDDEESTKIGDAFFLMMIEIASRVDVVPSWVRKFVSDTIESGLFTEDDGEADGDGAG